MIPMGCLMKRKLFTKESQLEAVRLLEKSGRPAAEVARNLDISHGGCGDAAKARASTTIL